LKLEKTPEDVTNIKLMKKKLDDSYTKIKNLETKIKELQI